MEDILPAARSNSDSTAYGKQLVGSNHLLDASHRPGVARHVLILLFTGWLCPRSRPPIGRAAPLANLPRLSADQSRGADLLPAPRLAGGPTGAALLPVGLRRPLGRWPGCRNDRETKDGGLRRETGTGGREPGYGIAHSGTGSLSIEPLAASISSASRGREPTKGGGRRRSWSETVPIHGGPEERSQNRVSPRKRERASSGMKPGQFRELHGLR